LLDKVLTSPIYVI